MSGDFAVNHTELGAGAGQVAGLAGRAGTLSKQVEQALTGAAEAVGHPGLAKALMETNLLNARRLVELGALYQRIGESLKAAAGNYQTTDAKAANRIASSRRAS